MKTFYAALVIFLILLILIVCNGIFIRRTAKELEEKLQTLPPCEDAEAAVAALSDFWEARKTWVGLSIPNEIVRDMTDRMTEVAVAAKQKNSENFDLAIQLSINAARQLRYAEQISIENLL